MRAASISPINSRQFATASRRRADTSALEPAAPPVGPLGACSVARVACADLQLRRFVCIPHLWELSGARPSNAAHSPRTPLPCCLLCAACAFADDFNCLAIAHQTAHATATCLVRLRSPVCVCVLLQTRRPQQEPVRNAAQTTLEDVCTRGCAQPDPSLRVPPRRSKRNIKSAMNHGAHQAPATGDHAPPAHRIRLCAPCSRAALCACTCGDLLSSCRDHAVSCVYSNHTHTHTRF